MTWHRKLFLLSFEVFDGHLAEPTPPVSYWIIVFGMMLYVAVGVVILLPLNLLTLPLGVFAEPIWWPRARLRLLRFPNGLPLIPFCVAIILAYCSYRTWALRGPGIALGGWFLVGGVALTSLAAIGLWNGLSRRLNNLARRDG
jgi:hypothetical protein